jgi:hypothetical protein
MSHRPPAEAGQSTAGVRELIEETLAGALLGAAGGLAFGVLFGLLVWAASGAAQAVLAAGRVGLSAAAAAGGIASFANKWCGGERIGWGELVAARRRTREDLAKGLPHTTAGQRADRILPTAGEVLRVCSSPPKGASNGQAKKRPPKAAPP